MTPHISELSKAEPRIISDGCRRALPALTGLRFFLAFHVVLFHFARSFFGHTSVAQSFVRAGSSSVSFFFLLSGLILTYVHLTGTADLNQTRGKFWLARFLRIYPTYFLGFLLAAPFAIASIRYSPQPAKAIVPALSVLLLLQSWIPGFWQYWNYPAWSLSVEACFYALFPVMLSLMFRHWRWNWWILLGLCWLGGLIAPAVLLAFNPDSDHWLLRWPLLRLGEFAFGMILGKLLVLYVVGGQSRIVLTDHLGSRLTLLGAVGLPLCYASGVLPYNLLDHGLLSPVTGCLVWGLATGRTWLSRILSWRPIEYLGEISYGTYILQFPVFSVCYVVAHRLGLDFESRIMFLCSFAILLAASSASFEWIEKPCRRMGKECRRAWVDR
jgi:peptidoglycan/LPS O-acetylase OafA/YrhL